MAFWAAALLASAGQRWLRSVTESAWRRLRAVDGYGTSICGRPCAVGAPWARTRRRPLPSMPTGPASPRPAAEPSSPAGTPPHVAGRRRAVRRSTWLAGCKQRCPAQALAWDGPVGLDFPPRSWPVVSTAAGGGPRGISRWGLGMAAASQPEPGDELGPVDFLAIEFPVGRLTSAGFEQLLSL